MSFTTGTLLQQESVVLAELYLALTDWNLVRDRVLSENLLQSRTLKSSKTICRVVISRLKELASKELDLLVHGSTREQAYLLWIGVCRRYPFIAEFAVELLRERYLSLKPDIKYEDFDAFFNGKAAWHVELDDIQPSTRAKLRQVLFKMLREAELLTEDHIIQSALLTPTLVRAIPADRRDDLLFFPIFETDLRELVHEPGN